MATVVNNPQPTTSDNGMGFFLGVLMFLIAVILFFVERLTVPQNL